MSSYYNGPMWNAFGLSRASHLVYPRRLLQSMPEEWQQRFVDLVAEIPDELIAQCISTYVVQVRIDGKFAVDPQGSYRHSGPITPKVPQ